MEGIATTQISLIREHTEFIRPPRALWVPFELGRPLGAPDNPDLQRRILLATLHLLEAPRGPVLVDFPDEPVPATQNKTLEEPFGFSCPVSFTSGDGAKSDIDKVVAALQSEVTALHPWYDLGFEKRGRTAVGCYTPNAAVALICAYLQGMDVSGMTKGFDLPVALRLAYQDMKAFYFEAAIARPGTAPPPDSAAFNHWFWQETTAGRLLKLVKEKCLTESDKPLRLVGSLLLVPMDQG